MQKVELPAAVVALPALQRVEIGGDHRVVEQGATGCARPRRQSDRGHSFAVHPTGDRDRPVRVQHRSESFDGPASPVPVRDRVQEGQGENRLITGRFGRLDLSPAPCRGGVEPGIVHPQSPQVSGDAEGEETRVVGLHPRGPRMIGGGGQDLRYPAVRQRDRSQPAQCPVDQRVTRQPQPVEHPQCRHRRRDLTVRPPQVRLQCVAPATVVGEIPAQGGAGRPGRCIVEQHRRQKPLQQPGVLVQESSRRAQVDGAVGVHGHARHAKPR